MRLDGQVHAAGLEHGQDGGHPVQGPLGHHRDHVFAPQSPGQQGARQPVGPCVEFPVRPLPLAAHRCDGIRVLSYFFLKYFVEPPFRQHPARAGEPFDLVLDFLPGQQALLPVPGPGIGGDQFQGGAVVAEDPGRAVGVEHVGAVAQPQDQPAVVLGDPGSQHGVRAQAAAGVTLGRIEHGLRRRTGQPQLAAELADAEVLVGEQLRLGPAGVQQQFAP